MLRQDRAALLRANAAAEARVADAVRAGTLAPAVGAHRRARLWANRASLLLRAERWRTALTATATAPRAPREGGAAGEAAASSQECKRGMGTSAVFVARQRFAVLDKNKQILIKNFQNEVRTFPPLLP